MITNLHCNKEFIKHLTCTASVSKVFFFMSTTWNIPYLKTNYATHLKKPRHVSVTLDRKFSLWTKIVHSEA